MKTTLLSGEVSAFPSANRDTAYDNQSRLLNEWNITSLIRTLTDNKNFVISPSSDTVIELGYHVIVSFCLEGYVFSFNIDKLIPPGSVQETDVYVQLDTDGTGYSRVVKGDIDGNFAGLIFSNTPDENKLHLLHQTEDNFYEVPRNSTIKYTQKSVHIDDGVITK